MERIIEKGNSVFSLKVVKAIFDYERPYRDFSEKETAGSGFIFNIKEGLVLTNFHVVENAISVIGRLPQTGKRDISLEVIGISREKDLAVCKILDTSSIIQDMINPDILNLKFADSLIAKPGDSIFTLGYPLDSSNIKITTGVISGFERIDKNKYELNEREDSISRSPSYIQISAAINPGSSGGPLLNNNGEVIGINSSGYSKAQNVGYAIPSRTFLAIYPEIIKSGIIKMPTLAFNYCKTNRELMKKQTGNSSTYGIYVKKVYPDTCFDLLEKGDIIRRLDYYDRKNVSNLNSDEKTNLVTVFLDRFGTSTKIGKLKNPDELNDDKIDFETIYTDRKMDLGEIMDMVPIGTDLILNINRLQNWYKLKTKYVSNDSDRISYNYPLIKSMDYEIFAGLCVCNLSMEHIDIYENLECYLSDMNNLYKKSVIITQVFPDTTAYKTQSLKPGHIIKSILGYKGNFELIEDTNRIVSSLEDIRHILHKNPDIIQITTTDDTTFIVYTSTIQKEDKILLTNFRIRHKYIF